MRLARAMLNYALHHDRVFLAVDPCFGFHMNGASLKLGGASLYLPQKVYRCYTVKFIGASADLPRKVAATIC